MVFAGVANAPGVGAAIWQEEHPLPAMLAGIWADAANALSALAAAKSCAHAGPAGEPAA